MGHAPQQCKSCPELRPRVHIPLILSPGPGFKETAFLYSVSAAALTHTLARACSAGRMERCTCDDSPGLESRQAWQWGVCGDNLKYSTKFLSNFLGPKRGSKDLRARVDAHNTNVGIKVSTFLGGLPTPYPQHTHRAILR